jgi:hypothetical protein
LEIMEIHRDLVGLFERDRGGNTLHGIHCFRSSSRSLGTVT